MFDGAEPKPAAPTLPEPKNVLEARATLKAELDRLKLLDAVAAERIRRSIQAIEYYAAATGSFPKAEDQADAGAQLERASVRMARHILDFFEERIQKHQRIFHGEDLREYVERKVQCAPGSPDRIMRDLKKAGKLDYQVTSRQGSEYLIMGEVRE